MSLDIDKNRYPYRVAFLNTAFDNVSLSQVREIVADHVQTCVPGYMVSLNSDIDIALEHDREFKAAHNQATLVLMDSQPLFNLARRQGIPVKEKISGSDLMGPVCQWALEQCWSIYILGGMPGVPKKAAENLQKKYPGLKVVGTLSPDYGFERDPVKLSAVLKAVAVTTPDILFVSLGAPKSEKFVHENLYSFGSSFIFNVGAGVDFAAGKIKRAPRWMSDHSLEWLYRFFQEPRRLFKRYFIDSWKLLKIIKKYGKREIR
ncbi:glycosyl transferase, WecB/TagA/CpsF family [Coriobacterium glomerans PW2]|uniref:Glycosyl transferase, WecB/TagA/CpsF family n=1 Tax=Coriobacterium glomerans (strain ATCC 49209 / DSM 20642 / JCM 10262 / PW2) TaxID=700015 RepID=F2N8B4_CORGP|nr:WecB/TagA/CpsF family glycosyltransferase [Coriobacterium glomerans]AEB07297.1 glycosyl transferase, WecB/TagA/CpsF family [Coriobacterium glomerans PW2]